MFFQNVMNAFLKARHESECRARLEEARVWLDKWRPLETKDLDWASGRVAMLQQMVEVRGMAISMTTEPAETICSLAENDPRVPLIEAKYWGMSLAELKKLGLTVQAVRERTDQRPGDVR